MVVLAPLVLSNPAVRRDYAVGPGRGEPGGVAPGVVLGWHQGSGLLAIAPAMCRLRPPYHCVLAVSLFFFGTYFGDRREIVHESSWRLDLV